MKCRTRVPDSHPPHGAVANLRQTWVGVRSQTGGTLTIPLVGVDAHRALRVEVWRRAHVPDAPPVGQALHAVQARQHHRGGDAGEARALGPGMFSATTAWWGGADLGKHSPADTFGSTNDNEKIRSHTPRQIPQWLATGFWPPMNSMLLLQTKNKIKQNAVGSIQITANSHSLLASGKKSHLQNPQLQDPDRHPAERHRLEGF